MHGSAAPSKEVKKGLRWNTDKLWDSIDSVNHLTILTAIRKGLALMIPFMIIGSFAIFINNVPVPAYQEFMLSVFGEGWKSFGNNINQATMGIMSLCINVSIGYTLLESSKKLSYDIHPMIGALVSLSSLMVLTNFSSESFRDWFGPLGLFFAMVTAFAATHLYILLCGVKWLRIKLYSNAAENHFTTAVSTLIPIVLTLLSFAAIRSLLGLAGVEDIHAQINAGLSSLFASGSSKLLSGIGLLLSMQGFWFFGIHGNHVLQQLSRDLLGTATTTNVELVAQGLPPTEILNSKFINAFVNLGGSGATICLIIALLIGISRSNTRQIAGISIVPAIINVNEVMIFGVPIALNLYLLIPFVTLPVILMLISYAVTAIGLVPIAAYDISWTTPVFFSGYSATRSIAGTILQLFNLTIGTLYYLPFVRMYERSLNRDNRRALSGLMKLVSNLSQMRYTVLLSDRGPEGNMARTLASELPVALQSGDIFMNYQPLVLDNGTVFSTEALLRWKHKQLGFIPPPVIIAVAEETGMIDKLGLWIFDTSIKALKGFRDGGADIGISINITPSQLDNPSLAKDIMEMVDRYGLKPGMIDIEITEQAALGGLNRIEAIAELREYGFLVAIDDFGMGHGSLTYLKDLNLNVIKIDGSLVKDIETNTSCRDIISTITSLADSMNINVIAEFVENEEQHQLLLKLGCTRYQGYLYSPALSFDEAVKYILKMNKERQKRS